MYRALRAANAPEDEALAAAEEVAAYDNRPSRVEGDLALLKWMVGANVALTIGVLVKLFVH